MRQFSTEISIKVLGYLIGEGENDDRPLVRIEENVVEYLFPQELAPYPGTQNIFGESSWEKSYFIFLVPEQPFDVKNTIYVWLY